MASKYRKTGHKQSLARARVLPPEINHLDMQADNQTITQNPAEATLKSVDGATTFTHITQVDRGDADNQRVASKLKGLTLQGKFRFFTQVTGGSANTIVHVNTLGAGVGGFRDRHVTYAIVQNKNPRGVVPAANEIWDRTFSNIYDEVLLRKHDQAADFRVLLKRDVHFTNLNSNAVANATNTFLPQIDRFDEFFLQLPDDCITVYKDASTGSISNTVENSLHMYVWVADGIGAVDTVTLPIMFQGYMRLRFLDM